MTDRFDPEPGQSYGRCQNCNADLPTQAEAFAHMRDNPHRIAITNATREERIRSAVSYEVTDAIERGLEKLDYLIRQGATSAEIASALSYYPDFGDSWDDYCKEED